MVGMHINKIDNEKILTKIYQEYCYGANLSIRMNPLEERPLLSFGHDECIFRQFIFTGRSWRGASGEQAIIPKHEGYELMVSAFQSRELGFGFEVTAEQLNVVDSFCQSVRLHYLETESTLEVQSTLSMGMVKERKDTGHTTTWHYNLRIVLMSSRPSSPVTTLSGHLVTAVVIIEVALMDWLWGTCKLFGEKSKVI